MHTHTLCAHCCVNINLIFLMSVSKSVIAGICGSCIFHFIFYFFKETTTLVQSGWGRLYSHRERMSNPVFHILTAFGAVTNCTVLTHSDRSVVDLVFKL